MEGDPILPIARDLANDVCVLCFDEGAVPLLHLLLHVDCGPSPSVHVMIQP
jgi:Predicted ATPase